MWAWLPAGVAAISHKGVIMKVQCINNGGSPRLIIGKIYDVENETDFSYWIKDEEFATMGLGGWNKERFLVVEEATSIPTVPSNNGIRQEKPCQVCKRNNDVGVHVCWNCGNAP
jgi:hypothetical protein